MVWVAIPEWVFDEDETNATLDLDDYCTDPDGDDMTYAIVVEDSYNITTTINTTNHIVTLTPLANWFGNTTFKYQANDSYISVNSSIHNVTVQSVNDIPIINSIIANTTVVNESEPFEVTVTTFDVEDSTLNYQFDWQSNGTWSINQTDNRSTYSYLINGTYTINARVWDSDGANATNNSLVIVVNDITSPAQVIGLTNDTPTWKTINLSWNANSEPDHLGYAVYKNSTLIDTTINTYYNVTGLVGSSDYEFNISAFDDNTNFGVNASVIITTPVAPPKPAITAWYNNITNDNTTEFTVDETISIYFNVTANQTIDSYSWYKNQEPLHINFDNLTWNTDHSSAGLWNITCVIENYNGTDSISWLVTINDIDQKEVTPSTSSGGGGGGGGSTGEDFENIILKDVSRVYINKDSHISYMFDKIKNNIQYVNFTALSNAGYISTVIEVLESTSALVNKQPEGIVYKNINIWVGKAGFATDRNIADQKIGFRVEKKWITENNIDSSTIKMNRYHQEKWNKLSTAQTWEDSNYMYFESSTPGFSPFTITGDVIQMGNPADLAGELETPVQIESSEVNNVDQISNTSTETTFDNDNSTLFVVIIGLLIIGGILALIRLKKNAAK
jgi:PGF-pre-PGF domain-containing protein